MNEAPAITTQPTDRTVNAGQTASFSASATGYPLPTVQWQQLTTAAGAVWQDIPGATSTTYDVTAQSSLNGYQYRAEFSNGVGDPVYSNAALLTVLSGPKAPIITQQPTDQTVLFGQTATFTAAANGNPAPTVKWQLSTDRGKPLERYPRRHLPQLHHGADHARHERLPLPGGLQELGRQRHQ